MTTLASIQEDHLSFLQQIHMELPPLGGLLMNPTPWQMVHIWTLMASWSSTSVIGSVSSPTLGILSRAIILFFIINLPVRSLGISRAGRLLLVYPKSTCTQQMLKWQMLATHQTLSLDCFSFQRWRPLEVQMLSFNNSRLTPWCDPLRSSWW